MPLDKLRTATFTIRSPNVASTQPQGGLDCLSSLRTTHALPTPNPSTAFRHRQQLDHKIIRTKSFPLSFRFSAALSVSILDIKFRSRITTHSCLDHPSTPSTASVVSPTPPLASKPFAILGLVQPCRVASDSGSCNKPTSQLLFQWKTFVVWCAALLCAADCILINHHIVQ